MIKTVIIEDEKLAVDHLMERISESKFQIEVIKTLHSVSSAIDWFTANVTPDLVFMDIQLADGISFEIFNYIKIPCPIIFTTAYQEYAIKAFKVNAVDYLLKPILKDDFDFAMKQYLEKSAQITKINEQQNLDFKIDSMMNFITKQYKSRFVINVGAKILSMEVENISCFMSLEGDTYLVNLQGKSYDIGYSLDQLENLLDPQIYFRINRKYIINIHAIQEIYTYSLNKLKVVIKNFEDDDLTVSRNRIKEFKSWLER